MIIGGKRFCGGTYVMAIINLTPDSFYSPSRATADEALFRAEKAVKEGAAILDIGAQSTRPGYVEISADEELERLCGPLEKIKKNFGIPVSVDTYFAKCARAALALGADMINDVSGLTRDPDMAAAIAEKDAAVCVMHNSPAPLTGDIWQDILPFLKRQTEKALAAGIDGEKICVDGGIGFAKNAAQNFELLNGYERLSVLGYPTVLGVSRKSMFGGRVEDRLPPTLAATKLAAGKGVLFVRVHDVAENVAALK